MWLLYSPRSPPPTPPTPPLLQTMQVLTDMCRTAGTVDGMAAEQLEISFPPKATSFAQHLLFVQASRVAALRLIKRIAAIAPCTVP